jgi:hypothetical protein
MTVALVVVFRLLRTHGPLLAVADGLQPVRWNFELAKDILGGGSTAITEPQAIIYS